MVYKRKGLLEASHEARKVVERIKSHKQGMSLTKKRRIVGSRKLYRD